MLQTLWPRDAALRAETLCALAFLAALALTQGFHAGNLPYYKEEPRRVIIAQEMRLTGDYLTPSVFNRPYYRKPPLHNWVTAAAAGADGLLTRWEARLPATACLVLLGLGVFCYLRQAGPQKAGANALVGMAVACLNGLTLFEYGRTAQPDILLALCCFASFALFTAWPTSRPALILSGLAMGLAVLTKGYGPLFFYPGLALYALVWQRDRWVWLRRLGLHAAVAALPVLAWLIPFALENDLLRLAATVGGEVGQRAGEGLAALPGHMLLFPLKVLGYLLPIPLLFVWRKRSGKQADLGTPAFAGALCAAACAFAVFWILPASLERYLLPAAPLLAVAGAHLVPRALVVPAWLPRAFGILTAVGMTASGGFLVALGHAEGLVFLLIPASALGGYAWWAVRRGGSTPAVHVLALALITLFVLEHGYYQAKGFDSPDPGPSAARMEALMADPDLPWVVDHHFYPVILGSAFMTATGRVAWFDSVAPAEMLAAPHYVWSETAERPGCVHLERIRFAKGPAVSVMRCGDRP